MLPLCGARFQSTTATWSSLQRGPLRHRKLLLLYAIILIYLTVHGRSPSRKGLFHRACERFPSVSLICVESCLHLPFLRTTTVKNNDITNGKKTTLTNSKTSADVTYTCSFKFTTKKNEPLGTFSKQPLIDVIG
jgi:hypothetical protein